VKSGTSDHQETVTTNGIELAADNFPLIDSANTEERNEKMENGIAELLHPARSFSLGLDMMEYSKQVRIASSARF
jgi:hypothetical protein